MPNVRCGCGGRAFFRSFEALQHPPKFCPGADQLSRLPRVGVMVEKVVGFP